jgi:DNA-binding NarL/FixJ family response regulator
MMLADDHAVVRQGVKQILAKAFPTAVFGEASNAHELLAGLQQGPWDMVVLDLAMPGSNGLDVLKLIKHDYPALPVLILSMYPEDQLAVRAVRAGAAGYLNKEGAPEELVLAVRKILAGGNYISASVADELVLYSRQESDRPSHEQLSDREYQVLCLIGAGKAVKEISAELSLSPATVSTYRARILQKMGLSTTAQLMQFVIQNGLVGRG